MQLTFEWDTEKEKINIAKHGIDFETASHIFYDSSRIEKYDELHSGDEDRYITIGTMNGVAFVVTVVFTERDSAIRLISARKATKRETEEYYDRQKKH